MIEYIHINGVATYKSTTAIVDGLCTFNYFYGANGSGKTTISRIIANAGGFPTCKVAWKADTPFETLVYNRDFVEKHFRGSAELPGIFTLGAKNADTLDKIAEAKASCSKLQDDIERLTITLQGADGAGGKLGELAVVDDAFKDACWVQKQLHDEKLKVAFEGLRNNAAKFRDRVLEERRSNTADLKPLDYIHERAETVFAEDLARIELMKTITFRDLLALEKSVVLKKKIVGKDDVDIAAMIKRLENSDWVRQGRAFLEANDETCPFCQQKIAVDFAASLDSYFDESFEADSRAIALLETQYEVASKTIAEDISAILANAPSLLNVSALSNLKKLFDTHLQLNKQRIRDKKREPSRAVELQSSQELSDKIAGIVGAANDAIAAHNSTVANLTKERQTLKQQVWKFLIESSLKDSLKSFDSKSAAITKAIDSLKLQIKSKEEAKTAKEKEIRTLERQVTSIQPTIDAINGLLMSFGFHGFTLSQAENKRCYKLIRADGSDVKDTLSEGEKTFITFLYFYHLLKGSSSESGITNDRVVVFDDPVSSLDSDILFIVSTLIRRLCEDVRAATTNVKQVFVLTHNVYFHKEVTFSKQRSKLNDEMFWTVRKLSGESQIICHSSNPIKSCYELLWLEVRERKAGNLSIQNAMRRILENYFKILGGIDLDEIQDRFEGNEKLACRALLSWVNDGSHSAHDDLFIAVDDTTIDLYLDVFRRIFDGRGHIEHYNMMMSGPVAVDAAA